MMTRPPPPIALALATSSLCVLHGFNPGGNEELTAERALAAADWGSAPRPGSTPRRMILFTYDGLGETRALVVYHGGRLAVERYAPGYDADTRFISWSMAKTVTAIMIGMLVADGQLRLDAPAPVPRWQRTGDPRPGITLRHLLQMRAGLEHTEAGDPPQESSEVRVLFLDGRDDAGGLCDRATTRAEPGAKFEYSSNTTVILRRCIAARNADRQQGPRYPAPRSVRLSEGAAVRSAGDDQRGARIRSCRHAHRRQPDPSLRDWARLGELLRNKGSYRGEQLVPRGWVEEMVTPSARVRITACRHGSTGPRAKSIH